MEEFSDSSKTLDNEKPKILQHGAFTKAAPFKEEKYCRHVSDAIANNYSPAARDFSTHSVYKLNRITEHSEANRLENTAGLSCQKALYRNLRIVKKKDAWNILCKPIAAGSWNEDHCEFFSNAATQGTECQSEHSASSNCMPAFDLGLKNSEPLPPIQEQINSKEKRHPSIQCTDTLRHKNQGDYHYKSTIQPVWIADCSKYLSPSRSFRAFPTSPDNAESLGLHRPLSFSQDKAGLSLHTPAREELGELRRYSRSEIRTSSDNTKKKRNGKYLDSGPEDRREHDAATRAVLGVVFPPSRYSTHGLSRPGTPTEGHIDRYYRLIEESIDPCMVTPLSSEWLQGIYSYIPAELCHAWNKSLQDLTKEAEENYVNAIKKSILDYLLLDPMEQERLGIEIPTKLSNSAGRERFPWHENICNARVKLKKNLHITHPVMTSIQVNFYTKYETFRLVDIKSLLAVVPLRLDLLVNHMNIVAKKRSDTLRESWLKDCCDIVNANREAIESLMPQDDERLRRRKMDHFFCSVATLMSNLLRNIVKASLADLVNMIETYGKGNRYYRNSLPDHLWRPVKPNLIWIYMKPSLSESDVNIYPSVEEMAHNFDNIVESLVISVQQMPRIEHSLFQAVDNLKIKYISSVQIHEEIVLSARARIKAVIENNIHGPSRYSLVYKPFLHLLSPLTEKRLEKLINQDVSLSVYGREIESMKKLASGVASLPLYVPMEMLLIDCSDVNQRMIDHTRQLTNIIINKVAATSEKFNRKICQQYDGIVTRISTIAASTSALVELQDYIDKLRSVELLEIKEKLEVAAANPLFLMDYASLSKEDIILNGNTFSWPERIIPIISGSETRLQREHDGALLKLSRWQQDYTTRLAEAATEVKEFQKKERMSEAGVYVQKLNAINRKMQEFIEEKAMINQEEQLLETGQISTFNQIQEICKMKEPYEKLWTTAMHFTSFYDKWMNGPLLQVNAEEVQEEVQNLWKISYKLTKAFHHPDLHRPLKVATTIKTRLEKFKLSMPLVTALCTPGIKPRHWNLMSKKVGFNITPHDGTSLLDILQLGLEKYLDDLNQISSQASKEYALEKALNKMKADWENICFIFTPYRDRNTYILAAVDEIQVLLDDHIVKTTTMKSSQFIAPFEKEILAWEANLWLLQEILECWLKVQMAWLYLEPIFGSEDIRNQIPVEGKKFEMVDSNWRLIMKESIEEANVMRVISQPQMLDNLKEAELLLDDIQKGLNDYLEKKRLFFPRFFFLSNDELLEILSETKDPLRVQPHLKKCFEGIAKLTFNAEKEITHMESAESESVELVTRIIPANAKGLVEKWLYEVERTMKISIQEVMTQSINAYVKTERKEWVLQWPGQVVLASSMVHWTMEVSKAIMQMGGLETYLKQSNKQIEDIVSLVRGRLTKMERITLGALITIDVHARDVVSSLYTRRITSNSDFSWIAQLRYYWEEKNVVVRMVTTTVPYGSEYLGNSGRLVLTPLTDRCFRTLMGALQLNLGGAPEGPAGTGKTETCKDLARAVAKQCVVFNCSDGLDYKAMGKFFKGLAQSGAWACFDEFNRIELEVLSVVAQQIQTIQRAISEQVKTFIFEGTEICLDSSCTVFITMNPGYAGRAELPDNLKVLFRTVAMMVPDYALIAEISLYSMGFVDARSLAAKIVATYRLCSEQLSSQHHYDYGMRAVKSVLTAAGNLKVKCPEENEEVLMLRSIRDVNLPKFLSHDIPLFDSIISDLFPGVALPSSDHGSLSVSIREIIQKMNLQPVPCFIKKIIQIYEMMLVRHGFMLIGSPLGGKTSALKVLAGVLHDLEAKGLMDEHGVDYVFINPKAITMGQLYGQFDPVSHEWSDGVLANVFRNHAMSLTKGRKWCIFDGPVDAVWVENINTVLDDNKKLCLMSGEIIQMSLQQNVIFEVLDLEQASPATVSRCGMIYMEAKDLGWQPLTESWLQTKLPAILSPEECQIVQMMCKWLLPTCLDFVEKKCKFVIQTSPMHLTMSMLKLYECLLLNMRSAKTGADNEDEVIDGSEETNAESYHTVSKQMKDECRNMLVAYGFFSVIWSVGGILCSESKQCFSEFLKNLCEQDLSYPRPKGLHLPKGESVYDVVYLKNTFSSWCLWKDLVVPTKIENISKTDEKDMQLMLNDIIVSTPGTAMQMYFLETLLLQDKPLLFVGPTSTGKTAITNSFLRRLPQEKYAVCQINFSVQTSANQTQDIFLTKLERRKKRVYGAPPGKRAFVFVDDLNMPAKEKYGAQPPIELLRQWIDHGYWFDRKDTSMMHIQDTSIVLAMTPPSGGRNAITPRLLRHFNILSIDAFNDETMKSIFQPITDWHFSHGFDTSLKRYSRILVWATMDVYRQVSATFLPMPSRSHYVFSLRDFSRVIQGITLMKHEQIPQGSDGAHKLMRLWIHEVYRVFCDRLVSSQDRKMFFHIVKNTVQSQFKEKMAHLFAHMVIGREIQDDDMRSLIFGDYITANNSEKSEKIYNEITDMDKLKNCMQLCLQQFNANSKTSMDLVMFHFAIEHISRISRILRLPCGHALLIGIEGTGRQSATKLAAYMADFELYQVSIQKSYTVSEWREDLKMVLKASGQNGTPTVFLFADHQIKDESFLEDISMILSTGDVPTLFNNEEKLEVIEKMCQLLPAPEIRAEDIPSDLYSKFKNRIRKNLHIVLAFSPTGEAFRHHLRHYPSLVNCCTVDWFQAWPEDALEKVANHFLDDVEMSQEIRNEAVFMCQYFHQSVVALSERFYESMQRHIYVTSTSYLELLKTFKNLLEHKRLQLLTSKNRYMIGLEKLAFASSQITIMQQELTELKPMLIERSRETEELVNIIADETLDVEAVKSLVEADEAAANTAAQEAKAIKEECEQKLSVAIPALNSSIAALDTLKASDITLLKTMQNPPSGVRLTLAAICILKGIKPEKKVDSSGKPIDDFWLASKKMIGDMKFLDSLKEFDKDNIPPKVIAQIRRDFISNPDFQPAVIKNVSSACEGLSSWVRAIEVYDKVAKIVAPKRQRLEAAEADLRIYTEKLNIKRAELKDVSDKLEVLQNQLSQKLIEKRILEENIALTKLKLERAEKLINGLGGEKERWTNIVLQLEDTYQNIVGDLLLSAGIVAYLGSFTPEFRQEISKEWFILCQEKHIPVSDGFALSSTLGDPVKIMEWQLYGLPKDNFSIENAIIVTSAQRWPLMIDPQGQANKWVKNMEKNNKIQICKASDSDYIRTVGNSIQFGTPVLIENITEDLDPILEPVLLRQTFKKNGVEYIRLGEAIIHYSRDFKLYMTTRLRNPHYLPEVSVKVTLINFMITPIGLEDQLLTILAAKEKPDLEDKKNQLYLEGAKTRKQLKEIEDQILEVLSLSQGNILEDERAIDILSSSKTLSQEIHEKQEITMKTEKQIDETRDGYRPVANHSSVIFFVISNLAHLNSMYQYSLAWFINVYMNAINKSEPSQNLQERITNLNDYFTNSIYEHVCRSLFEKHKLLFSFLLCVGLQKNKGVINDAEWHFLLTGGVSLEVPRSNPDPSWLKDKSWGEILRLSTLPRFTGLDDHFCSNIQKWKIIYDSTLPNEMELPDPWEDILTSFQKLLVIRCIRPDKVIPAVQQYVTDKMGPAYIDPPTFDLQRSYMESASCTPLIFVLSPGADPLESLMQFAEEQEMGMKLQTISLGQGQGPIARKMVEKAAEDGTWVILQNCHLATSWLADLEQICDEIITDPEKTKSSFRLWLTSYPSDNFPVSVLQIGIKMTNEPPKGLRGNLLKSYLSDPMFNPVFFNGCSKSTVWKKLLFGLCFFHALVQERRMYGSLGWSIPYEFNDADLKISAKQLQMFLNEYDHTPLDAITYLTGECNYGGRVTDEHDRRLLLSLLDIFICEAIITEDSYSFSPSGKYFAPKNGSHDSYVEYIKSLPLNTDPEVFGLHVNGNITKEQKETAELFDGILTTLPKEISRVGKSASEIVQELTADILGKIPADFNIEEVMTKYPTLYTESMNTVLVHELLRFNRLTSAIQMSLQELNKAISGLSVMSQDLDDLFSSLIVGKVPVLWSAKSYPSLKPLGSYIADLVQRLHFFKEWIQQGTPKVFWISGFFFTHSFLTGALQNYARKYKTPIDLLELHFHVTQHESAHEIDSSPLDGIYISGLYIEGARWDRKTRSISESFPKVLYESMPIIWLLPGVKMATMDSLYACPVYKTSARRGELSTTGHSTNYVLTIDLPTERSSNHWVNRGVACLCQLDY
ncbi:dynein axonemal heavy chain 3-like [Spea bombifrons]|uniref:dynein axonemal heavy chain 3-like n=1 Tax=Spea bombifrons TaxID=233779 RepID=UPI00234B3385|nr:dynein axonemal heavy chain 3-like [Spea bombifrons]